MACITQINENTFRIRFSEGFYEDGRRNSKSLLLNVLQDAKQNLSEIKYPLNFKVVQPIHLQK